MTDAIFEAAFAVVLSHEGSMVTDDLRDPGGLTRYGIALGRHPELTADQIRALTVEDARAIYERQYWDPYRWRDLPVRIAVKAFDASVCMGAGDAIRALQRACWAAGKRVAEDGVLGSETVGAAGSRVVDELLASLKSEIAAQFRLIAAARPMQSRFLPGWIARAYS